MTRVELDLPDKLASDLDRVGLLAPAALEKLLREQLREQRRKLLDEILDEAKRDPTPPMTTEEIQAEIDAYRAEKRRATGS
jgi:hypothetical protein